ncbi:MAG: hypothetical protein A2521_05495 [Deltaproteobacteria bacterium RIFOXYD12_FULL_57_12]|nr:MAG: hypothetical protein A2521_05495 [Deltaproteobacteria bacterium RIFOXYD12_FULL_57_12]
MEAVLYTPETAADTWQRSRHLAFFGLTEEPFQLTPDRRFFFGTSGHNTILEVVRYGIRQGDGFIIVTGEVGTGKTLLLRMLLAEFKDEYETALILSPLLSPTELLQAILTDIGREPETSAKLEPLLRELNSYLFSLATQGKRLAVIIDEAQNLPNETIEQVRLLSNFESDRQKWIQIILVGQPELRTKLLRPDLRQLLQRVTIMETLMPLNPCETAAYVNFRLAQAGREDMRLNRRARNYLVRQTAGVPRRINRLMGRALLVAYARHSPALTTSILKEANASLALDRPAATTSPRRRRLGWLLAGLACSMAFALLHYLRPDLLWTIEEALTRLVGRTG